VTRDVALTGPPACACGERAVYSLANVADARPRWLCERCILDELLGDISEDEIGHALANSCHGHLLGSEPEAVARLNKIQEVLNGECDTGKCFCGTVAPVRRFSHWYAEDDCQRYVAAICDEHWGNNAVKTEALAHAEKETRSRTGRRCA
jgi:hypothetical protein